MRSFWSVAKNLEGRGELKSPVSFTMRKYYVYILSNKGGNLYVGVTNNLERRIYEHKKKLIEGFTKRYNINLLMYFESCDDVKTAIEREKQIKGLLRSKKVELIKTMNPRWEDLSQAWFEAETKE